MEKLKNRESITKLLCILFLLFLPILTCSAVPQSNAKRVTLDLKSATFKDLFEAVRKQTGLNFIYNADQAKSMSRINVVCKDEPVDRLLERVINGSGYSYQIEGNIVTVYKLQSTQQSGKKRTLTGVVTDNDGLPLPGVNVFIRNTNIHTLSDVNGNYSLSIPTSACTVTFSYVGMKAQDIKVQRGEGNRKADVQLLSNTEMDEVVVTGIFKKARESYTGAATTVTSKDLQLYKGQNLLQTLKNVDASINMAVNNVAGSNPNTIPQINIRGNSSLPINVQDFNNGVQNTTNTPLIIMDGFEISLTKLMDYNDEEIASINILKDAAATAIYGSRGANGVIVVISKAPQPGRLKASAEIGLNLELPDLSSYHLLNASQKLEVENLAGLYDDDSPIRDKYYKQVYNTKYKKILEGVDTDWLSKPLRNGAGQSYKLRLEGGSNEFRWSADAGFNDVAGAMKGSSRRTFNGGITLMYTVKNLIFRNYTSATINKSKESKYGTFSDYVKQQPYNCPYDSNGNLVDIFPGFYLTVLNEIQNPLYDASLNSKNETGYNTLLNSFSVDWKILKELTLRGQFSISSTHNTSDYFLPSENSYFQSSTYQTDEGYFRKGLYRYGTGDSYNYSGSFTLSYNKIFAKKHSVYAGLNYEIAESNSKSYSFSAEGFSSDDLNFLGNALQYAKDGKPSGSKSITRRVGFTGNLNYTYDNRYYVDLSYRVDGSSNFGSDKKYAPFWSAGIGWNLHNEKFMKDNPIINTLRLKASYGQTGSMDVSATGAKTTYEYVTSSKYLIWSGATLLGLGNKNLTWQKTNEVNLGLEYGLLNYRVKGTFDFYTKKTSNLLSYMDLPSSMGFSNYLANVGSVKNTGFETSLNVYIMRDMKKDIIWTVGGQLVYNRNRITKLSDAIKAQNEEYLKQDVDVSNLFYEGRPQNSIYAVTSLGIDPSTGEEIFVDRNGNLTDTWKASDKVYQGSSDPTYRGIANTMFQWKGLTFNMSFSFYWGGKMYNQTLLNRVEVTKSTLMSSNVDERVLNARWQKPGDVVFFKKISDEQTRASSRFVMNNRVLELSSISLLYKWDSKAMRRWSRLQSITFGLNLSDLWHTSSVKMERGTSYPYAHNIQASIKFLY
jgi:TonB-linked SusC/RagA family outer membrane protein